MTLLLLQFLLLAAIIVVAGVFLSHNADKIAEISGLGRVLIGSILLAGATSMPELSVDIACIRQGNPDLAVGDLLGSSLMNLLILALLDLVHATPGRMFSRPAAGHALGGAASIALTSIVALSLFSSRDFGGHEWFGLGTGIWIVVIAYSLCTRLLFLDQRISARAASEVAEDKEPKQAKDPLWKPVMWFVFATAAIWLVGPRFSATADELAVRTGMSKSFVGTTLIAFSTSLPELVSCWAAVRIKAFDLAIGNVFGSNAFNMLILAALDLVHAGPLLGSVSTVHIITANAVILATSATIMGQLYHAERRHWLIEPDAILVILIVATSLWLIFTLSG
jgi:cation:H+ antiporter